MPSPEFQSIRVDTTGEYPVVTVTQPRLDRELLARAMQQELQAVADSVAATHWIIDLREIEVLHTIALQGLLSLQRKLAAQSCRIVLCGLTPIVAQVFEITGLVASPARLSHTLFDVQPDVGAAIAHLNCVPPPLVEE